MWSIQINNNGLISFVRAVRVFTPITLPLNGTIEGIDDVQLIAPFWGDVDTRPNPAGGFVWYRETTSQADLDRAQREIRRAFMQQALADNFIPRLVFIATWERVGSYNQQTTNVRSSSSPLSPLSPSQLFSLTPFPSSPLSLSPPYPSL